MYLWRKVLLFPFNLLRQRHGISVLLFIVHGHALWRGRMSKFGPIRHHYHVHLVDHSARAGCSTFCCATPCWREPTSSKQLSTVAAFCWFSVWSLSCRCRVKFSTQSSLAEIWVIYIFGWLDLLQILRILTAFSLCGSLLIVCSILKLFRIIVTKFTSKNAWLPSISFWISVALPKLHKLIKNTSVLEGTISLIYCVIEG